MKRRGPESDSYQAAVHKSMKRPGLKRSDVPDNLRPDFDAAHMPISGVSYEFSSAMARAKKAGANTWELLNMTDAQLSAYDPQKPPTPQE